MNEGWTEGLWAMLPECFQSLKALSLAPMPSPDTRPVSSSVNGIGLLSIRGLILPYTSPFSLMLGASALDALAHDFSRLRDDPDISAIVLAIDSPGGMVTGVHAFSEQIYAARQIKPVVAMVSGLAASAAYWIASAASSIVVEATSALGSIGVVSTYTDYTEKRQKEGIQVIDIVSHQSPQKRSDPTNETGRSLIQAQVDAIAEVFVKAVAQYRQVSPETVLSDFGQGGLVIGAQAVKQGLADRIGHLDDLLSTLNPSTTKGKTMLKNDLLDITTAFILEHHPQIADDLQAQARKIGFEQGLEAGKTLERNRIQAIEAQSLPGHEALIARLKFDGTSSSSDAALAILAAEKKQRSEMDQHLRQEAPPLVSQPSHSDLAVEASALPLEELCKTHWARSAELRAEFDSLEAYIAYRKADENGQIHLLNRKG